MLGRHRELGTNIRVAPVTKLRLRLGEQQLRRGRLVDGMTAGTRHITGRMRGAANVGARELLGMTRETRVECLLGGQLRKGDDRRLAALGVDMSFSGTMAALATFRLE